MTASHGRAGRRGRSWLTTALAASGLFLAVSGARPARACHIHHDKPTTDATTTATTPSVTTTSATSTATTPSERFHHAFLKEWQDKTMAEPQTIAPTSMATTPMMTAAARTLTPTPAVSPTVQDWHQTTAGTCMPSPPPCTCGTLPTNATHGMTPSGPLQPPSAVLNPSSATPAPEPSTILSAVALVGAFAWRRRAARSRA